MKSLSVGEQALVDKAQPMAGCLRVLWVAADVKLVAVSLGLHHNFNLGEIPPGGSGCRKLHHTVLDFFTQGTKEITVLFVRRITRDTHRLIPVQRSVLWRGVEWRTFSRMAFWTFGPQSLPTVCHLEVMVISSRRAILQRN
jgi:hypothetical protein